MQDLKPTDNQPPLATTTKDQDWLDELAEQSWQAELLISGLVIAGLFQLPELTVRWMEGYILQSDTASFHYLFFTTAGVLIVADMLLVAFGYHALLRGIWVALLGLNSVYPNGIDASSEAGLGPVHWRKIKKRYPNLSEHIQQLDKQASTIFSQVAMLTIIFSSISLLFIGLYLLINVFSSFFPNLRQYTIHIGIGFYFLITLSSGLMQYLIKRYPDSPSVNRWVERIGRISGSLFSLLIFEKTVSYISGIISTNSQPNKKAILIGMVIGFLAGMGSVSQLDLYSSAYNYLGPDKYVTFNNRPYRSFPFNYENLRDTAEPVFTPTIQADVVKEPYLRLFIPLLAREESQFGVRDLTLMERFRIKGAQRDSFYQAQLKVLEAANPIFINDQAYEDLPLQYSTHPEDDSDGLLAYVPIEQLPPGRHLLEIRKAYFSDEGEQKIVAIPFVYAPE
ncbi:MAG: hypothetical protein AAGJ82_10640 [Bacteroidota bacterium]